MCGSPGIVTLEGLQNCQPFITKNTDMSVHHCIIYYVEHGQSYFECVLLNTSVTIIRVKDMPFKTNHQYEFVLDLYLVQECKLCTLVGHGKFCFLPLSTFSFRTAGGFLQGCRLAWNAKTPQVSWLPSHSVGDGLGNACRAGVGDSWHSRSLREGVSARCTCSA